MSGWYSLAGYLHMKFLGGALTLLKLRRRYYFVFDEANCQLAYFKDETEFIKKKDSSGEIDIRNCAVSLSEANKRAFVIHVVGGRQYELEAENDQSALVWLNCLQHRKDEGAQKQLNVFHNALDMGSVFSDSDPLSRCTSSISLPTDGDMATMLDQAFQSSIHPNLPAIPNPKATHTHHPPYSAPVGEKKFKSQCTFYFSSTPPASESMASASEETTNPPDPRPPLEIPLTPTGNFDRKLSRNAESLQHWIRNWLSDQEPFQEDGVDEEMTRCVLDKVKADKGLELELQNSRAEIRRLQHRENAYRHQVQTANQRVKELTSRLEMFQVCNGENPDIMAKYLQNQFKFLNAEVVRLSSKWQDEKSHYFKFSKRVSDLEAELESFKMEYVYLLQSCIRVPLGEKHNGDTMELKLFGGDVHRQRVIKLVEEARLVDPTLPTYDSLVNESMSHVDVYGFRHSFTEESLALHYICTQLTQHYNSQLSAHQQHKHRWKLHLSRSKNILLNTKETRTLVRTGIPASYRSAVWRCLVHQQVVEIKLKFGKYYYRNLCSSLNVADAEYSTLHQKQVTLDLLRTMPSNVHFSSPACKGVNQLQQVLRAFCLHNPKIGYCQGMNFVAATCLLFLSPEDTFWFLVALTERYFVNSYFDSNLTGAQADQEVLKELVETKLPRLAEHLNQCDIDLATVTLNWFLALFFEAVPFQTMLRIWDCFLLEGPKVLFRFAMALLFIHQDTIIQRTDTISVMKVLKAAARLSYDINGLVKVAFEKMRPFPKRQDLMSKQTSYLGLLKERLRQKEQLKALYANQELESTLKPSQMNMEVISCCPDSNIAVIAFGHQNCGKIAIVDLPLSCVHVPTLELECRVVSIVMTEKEFGFVSLISSYLIAISVDSETFKSEKLWELKLTDVALSLVYYDTRLFAALANGSLAVIENAAEKTPTYLELYYIPIGPAPLTSLSVVGEHQLWCAMGSKAVILSTKTLDCIEHLYVASSASGGCVSFFEKILCFQASKEGVWLCTAHSCLVQLWDPNTFTCRLLFDISSDHHDRKTTETEADTQITAILAHENSLWVGTADGYLFVYEIIHKRPHMSGLSLSIPSTAHSTSSTNSYPTGRRVSTCNSSMKNNVYIPPRDEDLQVPSTHENVVSIITAKTPVAGRDSGYCDSSLDSRGNSEMTSESSLNVEEESEPKKFVSHRSRSSSNLKTASAAKVHRRKQLMRTQSSTEKDREGDEGLPLSGSSSPSRYRHTSGNAYIVSRPRRLSTLSLEDDGASLYSRRHPIGAKVIVRPKSSADLSRPRNLDENTDNEPTTPTNEKPEIPRLPSRLTNSFSSLHNPLDSWEYDDLFLLYAEEEGDGEGVHVAGRKRGRSGGLCSAKLDRTDSIWSLSAEGFSWSVEEYLSARRKTSRSADLQGSRSPSSIKLRRKDLDFEEVSSPVPFPCPGVGDAGTSEVEGGLDRRSCFAASDTASVISVASSSIDPPFSYALTLQMKLKIADKPVKGLSVSRVENQDVVLTCAGNFGDEEGILKWMKETKTGLWINDPVVDEFRKKQRNRTASRASIF